MAIKVLIPTPLRQYAGKQESLEVDARTVGELLNRLVTQHADLRRHLYTDDGKLRSFVNVYVNDEDIRYLQKENTPLKENDVVSIVPSIAGGVSVYLFNPASRSFGTAAGPGALRQSSGHPERGSRGGRPYGPYGSHRVERAWGPRG